MVGSYASLLVHVIWAIVRATQYAQLGLRRHSVFATLVLNHVELADEPQPPASQLSTLSVAAAHHLDGAGNIVSPRYL